MEKLKIGVIGLGLRGRSIVKDTLIGMCDENIEIVAVCDVYQDRVDGVIKLITDKGIKEPIGTTNYKDILAMDEVEAIIIMTAWEAHIKIAIDAMNAGKYVGMEVGGAYSLDDCEELVKTYERTGVHCMLLENCCYGKRELMILNMVRKGVFGEVVHCAGGYMHDLRGEVFMGNELRHYRLRNYLNRNCDNYPTHELVPIGKILDINNGNRMVSLTSTASSAKGMNRYAVLRSGHDHPLASAHFNQGDVINTVIKCANGETISLKLDTTLPRAYSRAFEVRGTDAAYFEDTDSIFITGKHKDYEFNPKGLWDNAKEFEEEYNHPIWRDYKPYGGHGGMDNLVYTAFVYSAKNNIKPPIDVYDAATYMSISVLSEQSIFLGSAPVAIPDFTHGKWHMRDDIVDNTFTLDKLKK